MVIHRVEQAFPVETEFRYGRGIEVIDVNPTGVGIIIAANHRVFQPDPGILIQATDFDMHPACIQQVTPLSVTDDDFTGNGSTGLFDCCTCIDAQWKVIRTGDDILFSPVTIILFIEKANIKPEHIIQTMVPGEQPE